MNPELIIALVGLVEEAIKQEPAIAAELQQVFSKPSPTPQDWQDLRTRVLSKSYKDLVPDSQIPDGQ